MLSDGSCRRDQVPPGAAAEFLALFPFARSYPDFPLFCCSRSGRHGTRSAQRYTCLLTSWPPIDPQCCQTRGQIPVYPESEKDKGRKIGSALNNVVKNPTWHTFKLQFPKLHHRGHHDFTWHSVFSLSSCFHFLSCRERSIKPNKNDPYKNVL